MDLYSSPLRNESSLDLSNFDEESFLDLTDSNVDTLIVSNNYILNNSNYSMIWHTSNINNNLLSIHNNSDLSLLTDCNYHFEFTGNIIPFSCTNILLVIGDKSIIIPCKNGIMLCDDLTITVKGPQVVNVKLIPQTDDNIVVLAGTKLSIKSK